MMEKGLLKSRYINLYDNSTAAQAIGYKELAPAILDKMSVEMALDSLKQATRRYAKDNSLGLEKTKKSIGFVRRNISQLMNLQMRQ